MRARLSEFKPAFTACFEQGPVGYCITVNYNDYIAIEIDYRNTIFCRFKQAKFNNDYEEDSFIIVDCITKTNRRKRIKVGVSYITAINKIAKQEYLERINNIAMEGVYSNGI